MNVAPHDTRVVIRKGTPAKYEIPSHGAQQSKAKTDSPDAFSAHDSKPRRRCSHRCSVANAAFYPFFNSGSDESAQIVSNLRPESAVAAVTTPASLDTVSARGTITVPPPLPGRLSSFDRGLFREGFFQLQEIGVTQFETRGARVFPQVRDPRGARNREHRR